MSFDVNEFRSQFPLLETQVNGHKLVYFDNGASSLKPRCVAETIYNYYLYETSNIHRGAHTLSRRGTEKFEAVRDKVHKFIHSKNANEIIFTRGVTESINLLANTLTIQKDDIILLSEYEHHSNIVPWKMICEKTGAKIERIPFDVNGCVNDSALDLLLKKPVKVISLLLYSNVTGVRLDVEKVIAKAKIQKVVTIVDAAQAMLHEEINVQKLDCDFLTFSGHKMLAPYGVGVLYGRESLLAELPPFLGGGSMISKVDWQKTIYQDAPHKFEAGTPSIADVLGLGTAIDFIKKYSMSEWNEHGRQIIQFIQEQLLKIDKVKLMGVPTDHSRRCDILSFTYEGAHASDVGEILDQMGVAVRAGHHCAQPLMAHLGVSGTVRVSLAPYNTMNEAEEFVKCMQKVREVL